MVLDEPAGLTSAFDDFWERLQQVHERSGVGNLVRPEHLYFTREEWSERFSALPVLEIEQLGLRPQGGEGLTMQTQPTSRFHGSVPAMVDEGKKLAGEGNQVMFAAANTGELERLADIFTEYQVPYRLGMQVRPGGESYVDETTYFATDDVDGAKIECGDLAWPVERGLMAWEKVYELAPIVAGLMPGRRSKDEITLFESQGIALEDIAASALIYERAIERKIGTPLPF